jgi:hypothetical protein
MGLQMAGEDIDPTTAGVVKDIERLIKSNVPRGAEVKQLYDKGDLARIGLLTGDSIRAMAATMADEMNACIEAHESITRMMRTDADATVTEIMRHASAWRERFIAYGEAARELQDALRTMSDRVLKQAEITQTPIINTGERNREVG